MVQQRIYYYGSPQRQPGGDGQQLAEPAPGGGVVPPGAVNPFTGQPMTIGAGANGLLAIPVTLPSWTEAPLGSQDLEITQTNVVNVPTTGGNASAMSGATVLANSANFNLSGSAIAVLTPANVASTVTLLTYNAISQGVFRRFGIKVWSAMGHRAIRIQVQVNGANLPGFTEVEIEHFFEGYNPAPVFIPFAKQDVITVLARNLDVNSAYLCSARLSGWRYLG